MGVEINTFDVCVEVKLPSVNVPRIYTYSKFYTQDYLFTEHIQDLDTCKLRAFSVLVGCLAAGFMALYEQRTEVGGGRGIWAMQDRIRRSWGRGGSAHKAQVSLALAYV